MGKKLSRRDFLKGALVSTTGMALAACTMPAVGPQTAGGEQEVVFEEMTLLRWHHRLGGWEIYEDRIQAFEEANPGVKVNEEEFPAGSAEYGPKIASMVAAGVVGDITWTAIGSGSFQFLAANDALAPLDEFVDADTTGFSLDEYYPRAVDALRLDARLLALPELAHGDATCLFFNRTLIEGEGAEAPTMEWTRDDLLELAVAMTTEDRFGFLPTTGDYDNMRNHTVAHGGELLSEDGTMSLIMTDPVRDAVGWLHDLFYEFNVAPRPQQEVGGGTQQMFLAGQLASYQSGGWGLSVGNVVEDQFEWDMVLMPAGPGGHRGGHLNVDGEAVTAQSENKQLAYEFCKYLTDLEAGVGIALEIGLAARPDVYEDSRIADDHHLVLLGQATAESVGHINPANLRKQEMQTTIQAIFDPLWVGDVQPDEAFFSEADRTFQEFLDKPFE